VEFISENPLDSEITAIFSFSPGLSLDGFFRGGRGGMGAAFQRYISDPKGRPWKDPERMKYLHQSPIHSDSPKWSAANHSGHALHARKDGFI
jgi:hypothetical protein